MPTEGKPQIFELQRGYKTEDVADKQITGPFTSGGARARGVKSEIFTDVPIPVQFQSKHRPITMYNTNNSNQFGNLEYAALPPQRTTESPKKPSTLAYPLHPSSNKEFSTVSINTQPLVDVNSEDYRKLFPEESWSKSVELEQEDEESGRTLNRANGEKTFSLDDAPENTNSETSVEEELDRARKELLEQREKRTMLQRRQMELRKALKEQERKRLETEKHNAEKNLKLLEEKEEIERKIGEERRLRIEAIRKLEQQREMRKKEEEELNKRLRDLKRLQAEERKRRLESERNLLKKADEERQKEEKELQEELARQRIELEKQEKLKLLEEERNKREELQRLREKEEEEMMRQRERTLKEEKRLEQERKRMVVEIERRQRKWEAQRQRKMEERLERRKARLSRLFSRSSSKEQSEGRKYRRHRRLRKVVVKDTSNDVKVTRKAFSSEARNDDSERFLGGWASTENQTTLPFAIFSSAERIHPKPKSPMKEISMNPSPAEGNSRKPDSEAVTAAPITSTTSVLTNSKPQDDSGYTDTEIKKYYENYYNEWYRKHKAKPTSKTTKATTTQAPVTLATPTTRSYQPLPQAPPQPMALPNGRMIQTEPPTNARNYNALPSAPYGQQYAQLPPQANGPVPLPYAMGQMPLGQMPLGGGGNLFGIVDPRQSMGNSGITKDQLDRTCDAIKLATRAFGIKDAYTFAKKNCMFIKMYYQNVTCDQIMHVIEYCGPKLKDRRKLKRS
ncbi:hypothetical protein WR25_17810 [Diploscapter pachys]|uniref:aECM cysteine-cradle domain-containing protein n=1 Tax=Diploscapter pachys TaxID=2018661 RepID=A0A2A2KNG3_9BILA|nr:hypothetical protein WR25_17810 [Diploscapter pachys]